MADAAAPKRVTRRNFLGWWMGGILTALTVAGIAPILVYLWPAPPKGQKKELLAERIIETFKPFREIRAELSPEQVAGILEQGSETARGVARQTLAEVRQAVGLPALRHTDLPR